MEFLKGQPKDIKEKQQAKVDALRCIRTLIEGHEFEGELIGIVECEDKKRKAVTEGAAAVHNKIKATLSIRTRKSPGAGPDLVVSQNDTNIPEELLNEALSFIIKTLGGRTGTHTFFFFKKREDSTAELYEGIVDMANRHLGVKKSKDGYEEAEIATSAYVGPSRPDR